MVAKQNLCNFTISLHCIVSAAGRAGDVLSCLPVLLAGVQRVMWSSLWPILTCRTRTTSRGWARCVTTGTKRTSSSKWSRPSSSTVMNISEILDGLSSRRSPTGATGQWVTHAVALTIISTFSEQANSEKTTKLIGIVSTVTRLQLIKFKLHLIRTFYSEICSASNV